MRGDHGAGIDDPVELGGVYEAELEGGFVQGEVVVEGDVCDFRRLIVADHRRQGGHEHERPLDELADPLQERLVDVHLEVAAGAAEGEAIDAAEGNELFDDCAIFTWSFGCTGALLPSGVPLAAQSLIAIEARRSSRIFAL